MDYFVLTLVFVAGLLVGSFLNVVLARLPAGESFLRGRSQCQACQAFIKPYDLVPIVSFFVLRGACRACLTKFSWRYPLVEFSSGVLFALFYLASVFHEEPMLLLFRNLIVGGFLILLFAYDVRHQLLPDQLTIPAIILALGFNIFLAVSVSSMLLGILVLGGFFLAQYLVSKGKAMGAGDVRMGMLMGVLLGWQLGIIALLIAYVLGALVGLFLLFTGKATRESKIPLGPFLVVGTLVMMLAADEISGWISPWF